MGKYKTSHNNNKYKISAPTWNEEFELPDGLYCVSDIYDYFGHILKKHKTVTDDPSIMIYVNKKENRITFKVKTDYYLELLTPQTMKLLGRTKTDKSKDKSGENVPYLGIIQQVSIHCNIVNNNYKHSSRVFYRFVKYFTKKNSEIFLKKILFRILVYWSMIKILDRYRKKDKQIFSYQLRCKISKI